MIVASYVAIPGSKEEVIEEKKKLKIYIQVKLAS